MTIDWTQVKTAEQKSAEATEATQKHLTDVIQNHLDATARTRNYDGILSLCTYATSGNTTFAGEGQSGVTWRDGVWAKGYEILAEVKAGTRPVPTESELIDLLPLMQWPA